MKIAIVKLSALGDIVHGMIVLQFIKKHCPESEIDWFVEKRFRGILENNPHINKIYQVNLKSIKESKSLFLILKELRKINKLGKYDLVIDMQGLLKSALIARIIPSEVTLGFDKNSLRESLAASFYNQTYRINYGENVINRNLALVSYALKFSYDKENIYNKEAFLYSSQKHAFNSISRAKQNIILIPGASYPSKCYPVKNFAELSTQIDANFLIVWGNRDEKNFAEEIKAISSNVNVVSKLSLDKLVSLVSQADLVVGSDTGPTHIAWALNKPSIILFGPTPGYRNSFTTKINRIIESDSTVNPYKINRNDFSIKEIKVNDIVKMAEELLQINL